MAANKTKWEDLYIAKLAEAVIGRDGKFHIMIAFMGIAAMPALILDNTGRIVYMNKKAEEHWGVKTTKVIGQQFSEILGLSEFETARQDRESKMVLAGKGPRVFMECFGEGKGTNQRQSVLKFPFSDDDDDFLLGALILPHTPNASGSKKLAEAVTDLDETK